MNGTTNKRGRRTAPTGLRSAARLPIVVIGLASMLGVGSYWATNAQAQGPVPDPAKTTAQVQIQPPQAPVEAVVGRPDSVSLADIQQAAASEGVPVEEVRLSMSQSKVLVDSIVRLRSDPTFGDIWVTYNPYKVHLRLARDNAAIVAELAKELSYPFETTVRGLSNSSMDALSKDVVAKLSGKGDFSVTYDQVEGGLVVRTVIPFASMMIGSKSVTIDPRPVVGATPVTGYGGLPLYVYTGSVYGWSGYCTGGFMMRNTSTNATGVMTAGHCADYTQPQWYNAETPSSTSTNRTCGGSYGDGKILQITGSTNSVVFTNSQISQYVTNTAMGGYMIGQQVRQGRLGLNGNPGGNVGVIASYVANYLITSPLDTACGTFYTLSNAFTVNVQSTKGDSGGPLMASYANAWYGLAITTASGAGTGVTAYSPWWSLNTSGWVFCSAQSC